jgi:3-hydroxyisobutyrate dehydrogenase-like beta-hydroxyacid dehydrogenase
LKPTVCVLGAGRMGSAVARALLAAGHPVTVWNRTPARSAALAADGALATASPEAAIHDAAIVLSILSDYETSDTILRAPASIEALRGKALAQLASGSPGLARETAAWAEAQGVGYLDGAIMATPNFIGRPEAAILYSGGADVFEAHRATLERLGGATTFVGQDPGLASALDTALLTQMWGALAGGLQAVSIAEAEALPFEALQVQFAAFKPVVDGAVLDLLERARTGRLAGDEDTLATIGVHYGAYRHLLEICEARGLDQGFPRGLDAIFRRALADGRSEDDFAALLNYVRPTGAFAHG